MAKRLVAALRPLPGVQVSYSVDSNAVFARIPEPTIEKMHERGWKFYTHVGGWEDSRLMCSWDTTAEDVDGFAKDLKELAGGGRPISKNQTGWAETKRNKRKKTQKNNHFKPRKKPKKLKTGREEKH